MSALFLYNAKAGVRDVSHHLRRWIESAYGPPSASWKMEAIRFQHLDTDMAQAMAHGVDRVFAVGGDGTVNAIGAAVRGSELAMGVIPKGSGNGFARHLGYSVRPEVAIRQSVGALPVWVDSCQLNDRFFANVAGIGLDAEVAAIFSFAGRRGFGPYAKATADALLHARPTHCTLEIDGKAQLDAPMLGVVFANGSQWGYEAEVSAGARITDGWLDVIAVAPFPLHMAPLVAASLFTGTFLQWPFVHRFRARSAGVDTSSPAAWHVDGEPVGKTTRFRCQLTPLSLKVLLPASLRQERKTTL